jgi:hypothetical protein
MANNQNLIPFVKGDPRCSRKGRPKSFGQLRKLAQSIATEDVTETMTLIDAIMRKWSTSKDVRLQTAFVEYAYGKVPTQNEITGANGTALNVVLKWADENNEEIDDNLTKTS